MVPCHISETTTIHSDKISYMFFSCPFGNVYEVLEKSEHFLNLRHKWVKNTEKTDL